MAVDYPETCEMCEFYVAAPGDHESFCDYWLDVIHAAGGRAIPNVTRSSKACKHLVLTAEAKRDFLAWEEESCSEAIYRLELSRDLCRSGNSMGRMA